MKVLAENLLSRKVVTVVTWLNKISRVSKKIVEVNPEVDPEVDPEIVTEETIDWIYLLWGESSRNSQHTKK